MKTGIEITGNNSVVSVQHTEDGKVHIHVVVVDPSGDERHGTLILTKGQARMLFAALAMEVKP